MGSIRTLQRGKRAFTRQQEFEGILRYGETCLGEVVSVRGFSVNGHWIQQNFDHELLFADTLVGAGGIRVFRRVSDGKFLVLHFDGPENPHRDRELYCRMEAEHSRILQEVSAEASQHPWIREFYDNAISMDLDVLLDGIENCWMSRQFRAPTVTERER